MKKRIPKEELFFSSSNAPSSGNGKSKIQVVGIRIHIEWNDFAVPGHLLLH